MNSVTILTQEDFLSGAVVDTRFDLKIVDVKDYDAVQKKLLEVCGVRGKEEGGGLLVRGNNSLSKPRYSTGDLLQIMARLTAEDGCPWDKAQSHESIRICAIEEAYELAAAIDNGDIPNIIEELGDLLLQSVFHANIAERSGEFSTLDVVDSLCKKLVSRHTHIFGDTKAADAGEALASWNAAKAKEHSVRSLGEKLGDLSGSMPALLYAQKAIKKLVKEGLISNVPAVNAHELLIAAAGAVTANIDGEAELRRETDVLVREFLAGRTKEIK